MKKITNILAIIVMISLLCGCTGGASAANSEKATSAKREQKTVNDSSTKEEKTVFSRVGDTISTPIMDITLTRFEFAESLSNTLNDTVLLPGGVRDTDRNPYAAPEGKILASFSFTLKNTGPDKMDMVLWELMLKYDDKYNFGENIDSDHVVVKAKGKWDMFCTVGEYKRYIDPLEEKEYRAYIELPAEVSEKTDTPLQLIFKTYYPVDNRSEAEGYFGDIMYKNIESVYDVR